MFRIIQFVCLLATATAFTANKPVQVRQPAVAVSTARHLLLNNEETEQVLKTAGDCIEGECSLDEVSELLALLKDTEKELESRLDKVMNMVSHLQHLNDKDERESGEVRAFVKDLLRVFNTDKPKNFPSGFSGDVGDGPTTAYKALSPKKWSAAGKN